MSKQTKAPTCTWPGKSGKKYNYHVYPIGTNFVAQPGNYIFAKKNAKGYWVPVYIGQTDNLQRRLSNHNEAACVRRNGGTHVHAHLNVIERDRLAEEKDLIQYWKPPCNDQHVG